jgi:diguanylate cyclase (GGDEF)-like protein
MATRKILIVDDDQDVRGMVAAALAGKGRSFILASDGVEAVDKALAEMPDLIVLDIMMPKMNGYQVCRLLKNEKATWEIPILMLSARTKEKDIYYGLSVGADEYVVKPFSPIDLRDKVDALLEKPRHYGKALPPEARLTSEADLLTRVNSLLDRKLQEMTFLQVMTKGIVSTFDEERILKTVLRGINSEIGYKRVAVFIADPGGVLKEKCSTGFSGNIRPSLTIPEPVFFRLKHAREPVVLTGQDAVELTVTGASGPDESRQQCLTPVLFREELKGVVLLDRQPGDPPFSEERTALLGTLAGQMGLALENARLYRATLHLSITDGLTGLYNARYFYDRLEIEISRARRYGHPLSLFMLDIDFFKKYNDSYGHLSGDDALRRLALLIREESRDTDTVARYGGEEFSIILPETGSEQAQALAERIRNAVETTPMCPDPDAGETCLTVSIGIATLPEGLSVAEELVRLADKALYRAKESGRNMVCVY